MADSVEYPDLVIVGAGLFGLTVAQQAVEHTGARVHIIDIRDHIGGNAYSYMDEETGAGDPQVRRAPVPHLQQARLGLREPFHELHELRAPRVRHP